MTDAPAEAKVATGRLAAFRNPGFAAFWVALMLTGFAVQIQTVAVGWHIYEKTRNPLDLGLVGLSQFLPALLLVTITGSVADRYSRRGVMAFCLVGMAGAAGLLWLAARQEEAAVWPMFLAMGFFGAARAFYNPARQSLVPNLVPRQHLATAIAANSTIHEFATICGPLAGGLLIAIGPGAAFGTVMVMLLAAAALVILAIPAVARGPRAPMGWQGLVEGFRFIWTRKPVLGAISLDLFAVFFGGVVGLLPVFASEILEIGPTGLGLLRAGPAVGALVMGVGLMLFPIRNHAGLLMFAAVAGFGLATFVFALSTSLWLSIAMLVLIGATDMVSVNIRGILVQLWTPDEVRGRVSAVNMVFIGTSNELGAFRAGVMAWAIGPVAAVAVGGVAILGIAGLWARMFPMLRAVRHLH